MATYPDLVAHGFCSRFCPDCRDQKERYFENLKQCTSRSADRFGIEWEPVPQEELTTELTRSLVEMSREYTQCAWCWDRCYAGSWGRQVRLCVWTEPLCLGPNTALGRIAAVDCDAPFSSESPCIVGSGSHSQEPPQHFLVEPGVECKWRAAGGQVVSCEEGCTHLVLDYPVAESGVDWHGDMRRKVLADGRVVGMIHCVRPLITHHASCIMSNHDFNCNLTFV